MAIQGRAYAQPVPSESTMDRIETYRFAAGRPIYSRHQIVLLRVGRGWPKSGSGN